MTKCKFFIKRFAGDEDATVMVEYTILLGVFVVAVITIMSALGGWVSAQWQLACNTVKAAGC